MNTIQALSLALGAAWGAGINLYAAVFVIGIMGASGGVDLPPNLQVLSSPLVLTLSGIMFFVEFFADKIPGLDSLWDVIHTFIRIPAGAVLAAHALGPVAPEWQLAAFLVGGTISAGAHATKAGARILINTSPEPFTNWTASITEDLLVIAGVWTALHHPLVFLVLLAIFLAIVAWLLPKIFRLIRNGLGWLMARLKGGKVAAGTTAVK